MKQYPISLACERTSEISCNVVQALLNAYPESRFLTNADDALPIHLAIRAGNMPVIQLLLQCDIEKQIRKMDKQEMSPLHLAAQQGLFYALNYFL